MNDTTNSIAQEKCYRHQRSKLVGGMLCSVFFFAMAAGSLIAVYWDIDGVTRYSKTTMTCFSLFWLMFLQSSLHSILAYYRARLVITGTKITDCGPVRSKSLQVDHVRHVHWGGIFAPGSVVLKTSDTKLKIYLGDFAKDDRDQLIAFLRKAFDQEIQTGWSWFVDLHLTRKSVSMERSRQKAMLTACLFFITGCIFMCCSIFGTKRYWLIPSVCSGAVCVLSLWRIVLIDRNQGSASSRPNQENEE